MSLSVCGWRIYLRCFLVGPRVKGETTGRRRIYGGWSWFWRVGRVCVYLFLRDWRFRL